MLDAVSPGVLNAPVVEAVGEGAVADRLPIKMYIMAKTRIITAQMIRIIARFIGIVYATYT